MNLFYHDLFYVPSGFADYFKLKIEGCRLMILIR